MNAFIILLIFKLIKRNYMKNLYRNLLCVSFVLGTTLCTELNASPLLKNNTLKPTNPAFVENKGQVMDQMHHQRKDIQFAINAASVTVQHLGVYAPSLEEICD